MQKADFFFKDGMFAQNDKYILKALCEEDKANYLMLYRENSIVAKTSSKITMSLLNLFGRNSQKTMQFMYLFS